MHRIDTAGSESGTFVTGNPFAQPPVPGTVVGAGWLNELQEELAGFIEAQGLTLAKGDATQLAGAVAQFVLDRTTYELTVPEAPYDVSAGDGLLVERLFAVAQEAATTGNPVKCWRKGDYVLPCASAEDIPFGATLYWHSTLKIVTAISPPAPVVIIGTALADAGVGVTTLLTQINGVGT